MKANYFPRLASTSTELIKKIGSFKSSVWGEIYFPKNKEILSQYLVEISRLKKRGYLEEKNNSCGKRFRLSKSGRLAYLNSLLSSSPLLPKDKVCLVIFDIPEKNRQQRELARRLLTYHAFIRLQKSVWFSQFASVEILKKILELYGLKKWTKILIAEFF